MKLAFLAPGSSIHTLRWVSEMAARGHEAHLISMHGTVDALHPAVQVHKLPLNAPAGYFFNAAVLRRLLRQLAPDLLHAHYASGYGTLARLGGFHPYLLSVWGSDVYDFPEVSPLHRWLLKGNLRAADWICSTSRVMAARTLTLGALAHKLTVTPFGIDVDRFQPRPDVHHQGCVTIGTVKTLAPKYGIDILLHAFGYLAEMLGKRTPPLAPKLRFLIVGGGPQQAELERLAGDVLAGEEVEFTGPVPHTKVPEYLARLDIYAALSRKDSESFGVAVLEASACGLPVVVSDAGGLPEVVDDGVTGMVVEKENPLAAAESMLRLVLDPTLRRRMGQAGRLKVLREYQWSQCATLMENVYERVLSV